MPVAFGTEYFNMLKAYVCDLLPGYPEFMKIFKSDLCLGCFALNERTGVQGFLLLNQQKKEEFPPSHKCKIMRQRQEGVRDVDRI